MRKKLTIAFAYRIFSSLICLFAMSLMLYFSINKPLSQLVYFTIQTNIFTLILFFVLTYKSALQLQRGDNLTEVVGIKPSLQLGVTFFITITFIVYWTLLSNLNFSMNGKDSYFLSALYNLLVHGVVPILAIVDWILFMPHGKVKYISALAWLSYPLVYMVFLIIRANVGNHLYELDGVKLFYPYPFLDPTYLGGMEKMIFVIIALCVGFYLLGMLYVLIDKLLSKRVEKKTNCK